MTIFVSRFNEKFSISISLLPVALLHRVENAYSPRKVWEVPTIREFSSIQENANGPGDSLAIFFSSCAFIRCYILGIMYPLRGQKCR